MTVASDLFYSSYASFHRLKTGWRPEKYIFILSHMRSGSSLLTHLLASNPVICGYGETRTRYFSRRGFGILAGKALFTLRGELRSERKKYVLDKVLHDRFLDPARVDLLCGGDIKVVFLLREPRGTLTSLVNRFRHSEARATDHYLSRLAALQQYGKTLTSKTSCAALTHDQLLHRTGEVFRLLERFLELDCALSETYQILPTTGVRRIGDPSKKILSGKIVREDAEPMRITISDETMKVAKDKYESCLSRLQNTCLTIDSGTAPNDGAQPTEK